MTSPFNNSPLNPTIVFDPVSRKFYDTRTGKFFEYNSDADRYVGSQNPFLGPVSCPSVLGVNGGPPVQSPTISQPPQMFQPHPFAKYALTRDDIVARYSVVVNNRTPFIDPGESLEYECSGYVIGVHIGEDIHFDMIATPDTTLVNNEHQHWHIVTILIDTLNSGTRYSVPCLRAVIPSILTKGDQPKTTDPPPPISFITEMLPPSNGKQRSYEGRMKEVEPIHPQLSPRLSIKFTIPPEDWMRISKNAEASVMKCM